MYMFFLKDKKRLLIKTMIHLHHIVTGGGERNATQMPCRGQTDDRVATYQL